MADEAPQARPPELGLHGNQRPGQFLSKEGFDPLEQVFGRGKFVDGPLVVAQDQVDPRVGQRDAGELLADVAELGRRLPQELPADRQIAEQVADLDGGSHRATDRHNRAHVPGVDGDFRPGGKLLLPAAQAEPADLGNRGQRFAPEAHRLHVEQVVGTAQLAGGVGGDRQRQVIGMNSLTVVDNPQQFGSPGHHVNLDPGRQGVDAVLEQLLQHARGAFDHLAGGNLVDDMVIELLNAGHGRQAGTNGDR